MPLPYLIVFFFPFQAAAFYGGSSRSDKPRPWSPVTSHSGPGSKLPAFLEDQPCQETKETKKKKSSYSWF